MDDPNMHAYGEDGPDDAEIGRQWRENSSLEKWFPLTAERLAALEAENAALKREAHTWSKAAEIYAADVERFREALRKLVGLELDGKHADECAIEAWERARAIFGA